MNRSLLGIGIALLLSNYACAKPETTWTCGAEAVPMGEVATCTTTQALTQDGPIVDGTEFDCEVGSTDPRCPPPASDTPTTGSTSDGPVTDPSNPSSGTSSGSTSDGAPPSDGTSSSGGTTSSSSSGGTSDGVPPGNGSSSGNNGSSGNGNGSSGHKGSSSGDGTSSGGTSSGGASSGGSSGATSSSGGGSSGGGASSSSSSSGGGGGGGKCGYHCKDDGGVRTCRGRKPVCAPGSHPGTCGACVSDDSPNDDCVPPTAGGCWVTGGGFLQSASIVPSAPADGNDNFGGNAKPMKSGVIQGHWNHVDHGTGNHLGGTVQYLSCRHVDEPGPGNPGGKKGLVANQAYFGGPARFQTGGSWQDGYWFDVVVKDHGEPGNTSASKKGGTADTYHLTVRRSVDPQNQQSGTVVYEIAGPLVGGNIQMHAPNGGHPETASSLPSWVSLEP